MIRPLRVYLATPISVGDLADNINAATDCFHQLMSYGYAPLCPAWSCFATEAFWGYRDDRGEDVVTVMAEAAAAPRKTTWKEWMRVCLPWVTVADAVLRLPGYSKGADEEVELARELNIPVFYEEVSLRVFASEWNTKQRSIAPVNSV